MCISVKCIQMQFSINRNIVECKDFSRIVLIQIILVLIETLWNVKVLVFLSSLIMPPVLIETLWNVKTKAKRLDGIVTKY